EFVGAGHAGVAPRAGKDRAGNVVLRRGALAREFAEHLVAVLVRPDAAALEARGAVHQSDHLGLESDAGPAGPCEQHRALQIDDRADPILTKGDGVTAARRIPWALETQLLA